MFWAGRACKSRAHLYFKTQTVFLFATGAGRETRDSVSDVIALLRAEGPPAKGKEVEEEQSSDSGTESSQPGEYEESDE